jgi:hypothetical protein
MGDTQITLTIRIIPPQDHSPNHADDGSLPKGSREKIALGGQSDDIGLEG